MFHFCSYTLLWPHLLSEIMGELLATAAYNGSVGRWSGRADGTMWGPVFGVQLGPYMLYRVSGVVPKEEQQPDL